jgi:polyisoprenoid-binding protein YceI
MKTLLSFFLLGLIFWKVSDQNTYRVDTGASSLQWTGHAQVGAYSPTGTLKVKSGSISINKGQLITDAELLVDMNSLDTKNDEMKKHLKGKDFFDVARYPEAKFQFKTMAGKNVIGTITIKGISLTTNFPFKYQVKGDSVFIKANIVIDRTKYGIKYNSTSYFQDLGSYAIKNEFDLSVNLVATKQ